MKDVKIEQLLDITQDINIIDIRDKYMYEIGHIPNATNIPMNFLLMNPKNYLIKDQVYYIYCNRGINSKKTCDLLLTKGYHVINMIGGYNEYLLLKHRNTNF